MGHRFLLWRDKWLFFSLLALFNSGSTYIRVLIRSVFEGREFMWSYYSGLGAGGRPVLVSGQGLFGHTDHLLLNALVVLWLLWMGSRKPDRFFRAGFAGWTTIQLGVGVWLTVNFGSELRVSKETIGIVDVPMAWFSLPPLAVTWALSVGLLIRGLCRDGQLPPPAWTRLNTVLLAVGGGLVLTSALVLNLGPQNGSGDLAGVGLIYMGLIASLLGVAPWERRAGGT